MLTTGVLGPAFSLYWEDIERCRRGSAYWSLLHVTVCLPDICAALQADDGESSKVGYIGWCDQYLPSPLLSGAERYRMRCKVLHQGRATVDQPGRYNGFSFAQPASNGQVDHMRVEGSTLVLDVGRLADEARAGVTRWIADLEAAQSSALAVNVDRNVPTLVRVRQFVLPASSTASMPIATPFVINRSS